MVDIHDDLSIGKVSEATGISVHTLRQWERRYGFPASIKLNSGHRRYSQDEVTRLRLVARALDSGHRAHAVVPLSYDNLLKLLSQEPSSTDSLAVEAWLRCVKEWDTDKLQGFCDQDWQTLGPVGFVEHRVAPFLKVLGESWSSQVVTVAQEHFFSELIGTFLARKWRDLSANNTGEKFILTSPSGEEHNLGLHMCAVILATTNKQIVFLGSSTPIVDIVHSCNSTQANALCMSFASSYSPKQAENDIYNVREKIPSNYKIIVGGQGAPSELPNTFVFSSMQKFYDWLQYFSNTREGKT